MHNSTSSHTAHEAPAILMAAWERLERAETQVRIGELRLNSLVIGAPLRYGVEATSRYRAAIAERDEARLAFDAAQDIDCPEM